MRKKTTSIIFSSPLPVNLAESPFEKKLEMAEMTYCLPVKSIVK